MEKPKPQIERSGSVETPNSKVPLELKSKEAAQSPEPAIRQAKEQGHGEGGGKPFAPKKQNAQPRTQEQIAKELLAQENLNPQWRKALLEKYGQPSPGETLQNPSSSEQITPQSLANSPIKKVAKPAENSSESEKDANSKLEPLEKLRQKFGKQNDSNPRTADTKTPGDFTPFSLAKKYGSESNQPKKEPTQESGEDRKI